MKPELMSEHSDSAGHWTAEQALRHVLGKLEEWPELTQIIIMAKDPVTGEMYRALAKVRCTEAIGMCHRTIAELIAEIRKEGAD